MKTTYCFSLALLGLIALGHAGRAAPVGERGLVAYWSFDEAPGQPARDYSGNGQDLRLSGVRRTKGICGNALEFHGRDSILCARAEDGRFIFPADYTLSVWVKHDSKQPQRYLSKWSGKGDRSAWWLGYYENKAQFGDYFDGGQCRPQAVDVADGKWHQVVGVRRGKVACLYVDGRLAAKASTPGLVAGYNNVPVVLGASTAGGWGFKGVLDEVRIYSRALSAREIREQYQWIRSGRKQPTLRPLARVAPGAPPQIMLFPGPRMRSLNPWFPTKKPVVTAVLTLTRPSPTPWKGELLAALTPLQGGPIRTKKVPFTIPPGIGRRSIRIDWSPCRPGKYRIELSAPGNKYAHASREVAMLDLDSIVQENLRIRRNHRRTLGSFGRGIVSSYAGLLWTKDGRPDIDRTLKRIRDLGVNNYTYLISGSASDRALAALPEFCTKAAAVNLEVWAYLVPPTEAPIGRNKPIAQRKYPPFDMDYLKWAEAIAKIGATHPNLTLWMIDDFDGNTQFFTVDYTRRIYQTSKRIAPRLRFGVCVYYDSIRNFVKAGYYPWFDAVLWGYQHSFSVYPDAGISAATLPVQIHDYYKLCPDKIQIPCIYFTAHSSWPRGRPTREYLAEALRVSFEQAGICWVFTTPPPGSWKARLVREFCRTAGLRPFSGNSR